MLELEQVSKSFDEQVVLDEISLEIDEGEVLALLGPSGSGKTTLIRIIAGLETADRGRVLLGRKDLAGVPIHERGFGMVFQDYSLFPHKNVAENVGFGLRMMNWSRQRIADRVIDLLSLVGLEEFADRAVYELSGGEQQRVALARALAPEPRLLLLDEPLGALDRALRERLLAELRSILMNADALYADALGHKEGAITALYVTHDQGEAFAIADRVAVLNAGRLEQIDTPVNLYRRPRTPFVARFIGMENLFPGRIVAHRPPLFSCALGEMRLDPENIAERSEQGEMLLLVRPDAGRLVETAEGALNVMRGTVDAVSFRGRYQEISLTVQNAVRLSLEFDAGVMLPGVGEPVVVGLNPRALILLEGSV